MAAREISAIKIKMLRYGDVLTAAPTEAGLSALFKVATEVKNSHQDTFSYEESEPKVDTFKNQLSGQPYRTDVEAGEVKMKFTLGAYDFATKAALQGGTGADKSWERGNSKALVTKAMYAITEDDVLIIFPKATIIGTGANTDKAIGLSITASPMEISSAIKSEYWFDVTGVDLTK